MMTGSKWRLRSNGGRQGLILDLILQPTRSVDATLPVYLKLMSDGVVSRPSSGETLAP